MRTRKGCDPTTLCHPLAMAGRGWADPGMLPLQHTQGHCVLFLKNCTN